jgi:hypothetical protein
VLKRLGVEGLMSGVQGMEMQAGKAENLEKRVCRKKMEEKLKPARFKNRSMRHPRFVRPPRACHPPLVHAVVRVALPSHSSENRAVVA